MARPGRKFEEMVTAFFRARDPLAKVEFDLRIPDADTGTSRQIDGRVTLRILDHIPVTLLISCKDHERPLTIEQIGHFLSEMNDVRANGGVIFSRAGFSANAIEKARKNSVSCCKYFDDAPPELPSELLVEAYLAFPEYTILNDAAPLDTKNALWRTVLGSTLASGGVRLTIAEKIAQSCARLHERGTGSTDGFDVVDIPSTTAFPAMRLHIALVWRWFMASTDAFRLRGSFNVTHPDFKGQFTAPTFPFQRMGPSSAWQPCAPPPPESRILRVTASAVYWPTPDHVLAAMGSAPLSRREAWTIATAEATPNWNSPNGLGMQFRGEF